MFSFTFDPHNDDIQQRRRRVSAAYQRVPGHEVPVIGPSVGKAPWYSLKESLDDLEKKLESAVGQANIAAVNKSDWPPILDTYCSICLVPQAFGGKVIFTESGNAANSPLVTDISQVWTLKPMPLLEAPMIRRLFDWVDYAQCKVGTDLPFWSIDLQSPFSAAMEICDSVEFLTACYSDPKAVHHLVQMVTDYSIELMQRHLAQMEHPGYPGRNFPSISQDIGICIADDTPLAVLSPEMYREFALPYNSQIGVAFGGLHVHSCGDYNHNLDVLLETANLRSIQVRVGPGEFHLPVTAIEDHPFNRARQRVTYSMDVTGVGKGDQYSKRPERDIYEEYLFPRLLQSDTTGCILQSCTARGLKTPEEAHWWTEWTREQLRQGMA